MNLALKICIFITVILSLGAYIVLRNQSGEIKQYFRQSTEEPLIDLALLLASGIETGQINPNNLDTNIKNLSNKKFIAKIYDFEKSDIDLRIFLYDKLGKIVYDSRNSQKVGEDYSQWRDVSLALKGEVGSRTSKDDPNYFDESVFYITVPIKEQTSSFAALTIGKPSHNSNLFVENAKNRFIKSGIIFFGILLALILLSVLIFTNPIKKLTIYTADVANNHSPRLPKLPNDEIGTLGDAIEKMKKSLEGKDYIEKYVRTVTHEMKSPLTGIKASAEIIPEMTSSQDRQKFTEIILRETERLNNLVDDLSLLSNIQNKELLLNETINLKEIFNEVKQELSTTLVLKRITLDVKVNQSIKIKGNSYWFKKAIYNLIQNACEFSPLESQITVNISDDNTRFITIEIEDQGTGIPEWALPKIFDPFFSLPRPETKQRSSGLGLTLVKEIIQNHGGTIQVQNRNNNNLNNISGTKIVIKI